MLVEKDTSSLNGRKTGQNPNRMWGEGGKKKGMSRTTDPGQKGTSHKLIKKISKPWNTRDEEGEQNEKTGKEGRGVGNCRRKGRIWLEMVLKTGQRVRGKGKKLQPVG